MFILKSLYHFLASLRISDAELVRHALKSLSTKRLPCNSCNQTGSLKIQSHYHRYCIHAVNGRRMEERPYFMAYPLYERQKVKFVCCDMHGGYITLARECFPCATVCVDPFHVVRRVSDALDEVRIRVQRELQEAGRSDDYKSLKDCAKIRRTAGRNHEKYWAGKAERNEEHLDLDIRSLDVVVTVCNRIDDQLSPAELRVFRDGLKQAPSPSFVYSLIWVFTKASIF